MAYSSTYPGVRRHRLRSSACPGSSRTLKRELEEKGLWTEVQVIKTGCFGLCALGPIVIVYPEGSFYSQVTRRTSRRSWRSTCSRAASSPACSTRRRCEDKIKSLDRHQLLQEAAARRAAQLRRHRPREHRRVHRLGRLSGAGQGADRDDPRGGHRDIKDSGLRGRGGAGFPTG